MSNNDLLQQINETIEDSYQSSERSVQIIRETVCEGEDALNELKNQGEQIDRMNRRLIDINGLTQVAQYHMRSIKSVFGSLFNSAAPTPTVSSNSDSSKKKVDSSIKDNTHFSSPKTDQPDQIDLKIEQNLNEIEEGVDVLKRLAIEMGDEIDLQNKKLETTDRKTHQANWKLKQLNDDINKL
jgi:hypothetical protein